MAINIKYESRSSLLTTIGVVDLTRMYLTRNVFLAITGFT
jgi:hypothetical protein